MVNTMLASTQRGRYCSGPVRNNSTNSTMPAKTSCATWLRAPALSAIAVCVGLPLTTKRPAHRGSRIRGCQPEDVRILVDALMMPHGIYARGRGALRDYHHEA